MMERKKCFVCLKESLGPNKYEIHAKEAHQSSDFETGTVGKLDFEVVKNQCDVIFLLRKFLNVPNDMCCRFLQDYGDPIFWIHCCDSCSVFVEKAKDVFDKIVILQKKFEKLQMEFKNVIIRSVQCETEDEIGVGGTVRYFVSRVSELENEKDLINISNDSESEQILGGTDPYFNSEEEGEDVKLFSLQEEIIPKGGNDLKPKPTRKRKGKRVKFRKQKLSVRKADGDNSCLECGKKYSARSHLKRHLIVHSGKKPFSCEQCSKSFSDKSVLRRHTKIHGGSSGEKVKSTNEEETAPIVVVTKPEKIFFIEEDQDSSFEDEFNLLGEKSVVDGQKVFTCRICEKKYSTWSHLKRHAVVHTGEKSYGCTTCEKKFATSSHLKRHERIHSGEKPYICDLCGQNYSDPSTLRKHVRKHTGGKPYGCRICLEGFENVQDLNVHQEAHTEIPDLFKCGHCEMSFSSEQLLTSHSRLHKDKIIYSCDKCGKTFPMSYLLKRHQLRVHIGAPLNFCDRCGKGFTSASVLRRHLERHDREGSYPCDLCGQSFAELRHLERHKKEHTDLVKYPCRTCGKIFFAPQILRKHEKLHTGEKPHSCYICQKAFINMNSLKRHERTHTGEKPYKCDYCEMSLTTSSDLRRHIRRRHQHITQIQDTFEIQTAEIDNTLEIQTVEIENTLENTLETVVIENIQIESEAPEDPLFHLGLVINV